MSIFGAQSFHTNREPGHLTLIHCLGNHGVPAHERAQPLLIAGASPIVRRCRCAASDNTLYSAVSSSPFPLLKIKEALYKVRGDLYAGAMKLHEDSLSIKAELELLVDEKDGEEIWNLTVGDSVEVGPFRVRNPFCTTFIGQQCVLC